MPNTKKTEKIPYKQIRKQSILDVFGPEGTIPAGPSGDSTGLEYFDPKVAEEYNSITLPVPKGLTPDFVALVAMGAGMDSTRYDLKKVRTASSPGSDTETFNQGFLYMNICYGEKRVRGFSDVMVDSRKQAKAALEAYEKGDPTLVNKYIKNIAVHAKKANLGEVALSGSASLDIPALEMRIIVNDLINNSDYDISGIFTEKEKIQYKCTSEYIESLEYANDIEDQLNSDPPEAGSDERKNLVDDLIFNKMLVSASSYGLDIANQVTGSVSEIASKYKDSLASPASKKYNDVANYLNQRSVAFTNELNRPNAEGLIYINATSGYYETMLNTIQTTYTSPIDAMVYEDGGKQKVKELFINHIRELPEYKAVVEAKNPEEMKKALKSVNDLTLENLSSKVDLDTSFAKSIMENDPLYVDTIKEADRRINIAVCHDNEHYFKQKVQELEKESNNSPAENEYYDDLISRYTELADLNHNHDITKGPIINAPEYKEKLEGVRNLENAAKAKKDALNSLADNSKLLNSEPKNIFQSGHKDSDEIIALREKSQALAQMLKDHNYKEGDIRKLPQYQQAAFEAYKASIAYQKKVAKSHFGKNGWTPSSEMGKDRYKGALEIEKIAKTIAPELIADQLTLDEGLEQIKSINNKKDFDNIYKDAVQKLKNSAPPIMNENPSTLERFVANEKITQNIARIIAIKTINTKYETAIKEGSIKEIDNSSRFNADIIDCTKAITERADFKQMMKDNSVDDLINAATTNNGKDLIAKLGQAHIKVGRKKINEKMMTKKQPAPEVQKAPEKKKL